MVNLLSEKTSGTNVAEFTVSEIAGALKRVVEEKFGYVRVRGEISGYRGAHASGHAYFALKDDKARLEAVIWRGVMEKLKFPPEEGMEVVAVGKLTTYPGSSKYQIVIEALEPTGVGALMTLLENRKKKFAEEGLFDEAKKKPLPYMPRIIGVVTSPTGAVIRDIIHRISDRFPLHVLVWPVRVQGETSGSEVAAAVEGFNALASEGHIPKPDLIIVARGGGSLEDLWGFNDEAVVRAVYASDLPIISAVGHETDWTLIDYVADWRAPTPTGAAEKAVPVKLDLEVCVASLGARLRKGLARSFDFHQQKLCAARRGLPSADQLFSLPRRGFDEISSRLQRALCVSYDKKRFSFHALHLRLSPRLLKSEKAQRHTKEYTARLYRAFMRSVEKKRSALELACRLLKSTSYQNILERGFVLVLGQNHKPIKRLAQFPESGQINLRFFDGDIHVATQEPFSAARSKHKKIKSPSDDQGTLF
ncbi:exodeoxyribonuclease VII large subunit [Bartonella tribocorum]|uniref:Exodeoxyribonuclease 7 large subunit n=1 Tax=Bartonella tribocorum (strain DSM 28219 / CCUG 45778 / CIP 105476 / IBS 506) TaxID=382640 RepID=EX7L_BART1|nr:exodeoxyribonuclease VII large subunit [Bartonella tribocorum]A9IXA1.1 RecName: Full=Exodeoxyribonuclease 7 large subunit; AltName: Full=Exodeoxyribonuclease VII large subunit; Short=Exonuclease VII large subunit [Bartonella tribocorum CIP 105476]CAK02136.1 exodeoxyribonuclease VII large subunit [Bartonella tribocorum CIP 105476]CDO49401.1 exodeoxyribonuclease VII large subunit [Bartonella tribocorum]